MTVQENLFFAEEPLIEAVRAGVPDLVRVGGYTDLPTTIETAGAVPAAFVVYEGSARGKGDVPGAALNSQYWTVAVLVRRGDGGGQVAARAQAGVLLAQVNAALLGLRLDGCKPLSLYEGPSVRYYPGGQAVFYLTYQLTSPLSGNRQAT